MEFGERMLKKYGWAAGKSIVFEKESMFYLNFIRQRSW